MRVTRISKNSVHLAGSVRAFLTTSIGAFTRAVGQLGFVTIHFYESCAGKALTGPVDSGRSLRTFSSGKLKPSAKRSILAIPCPGGSAAVPPEHNATRAAYICPAAGL